jgi:hypothetical protein
MTLSTLQGMNVNMAEMAKAFTAKMPDLQPEAKATEPPQAETKGPAVDPMQWWGSLTQQFQNIAAAAVKDVAAKAMKEGAQPRKKTAAKKTTISGKASKPRAPRAKKPAP